MKGRLSSLERMFLRYDDFFKNAKDLKFGIVTDIDDF